MARYRTGMGKLFRKRRGGRLVGSWTFIYQGRYVSTHTTNKEAAERFQRRFLGDERRAAKSRPTGVRITDLLAIVKENYERRGLRTMDRMESRIETIQSLIGNRLAEDFDAADVDEYIDVRDAAGLAPASINRELETIRRGFRLGVEHKKIFWAEIEPVRQPVHLPDQANAAIIAGTLVEVGDEHADYPALVLGVHILGGGWLNSRLAQRLRQREGLSYMVMALLFPRYGENSSRLGGATICAPENLAKAEAAMKEEFERAVGEGFREAEVEGAKKAWIEQQAVMRADDARLANLLAANERDGRTMAWQAEIERKVQALTAEDVNAAMRRHVKPAALSFFLAGDLEKAGIAKN